MTARPILEPESLQDILASAFVVQQRLMDVHLDSAIPTLRTLVATGNIDVNAVMHVIAGRARNVANATGAAIGMLKRDGLVYQAGSGSAANYVGRHVTATLSISAKSGPKSEILRVEDAETCGGIGREICRQFDVKSLIILPIYHEQVLGGVLQVAFSEPHNFQDGEIRAYQSMANVVGELTTPASNVDRKKSVEPDQPSAATFDQTTPPMQTFPGNSISTVNSHVLQQAGGVAVAESEKPLTGRARPVAATITCQAKRLPLHIRIRKVVDFAVAVVVVFVTASWIVYSFRRPVQPLEQVGARTKLESAMKDVSTRQNASVPKKAAIKIARSAPRRVRIKDTEIDYISEDVTVRHFKRNPARQNAPVGYQHVEYVSEDVTVRRFMPRLAVDHGVGVAPR